LGKLGKDDWVVLELSSFQLIDLQKSPHIAVVLMTVPEHQDWHKGIREYVEAKKNIVSRQSGEDIAVVNRDYLLSREIGKAAGGKVVWVSGKDIGETRGIGDVGEIKLRGEHNWENIVAAAAAARAAGVSDSVIGRVVKEFRGLEHRLEEAGEVKGVKFYNDSFSTTPETAIAAIKSFSEPEIVILGGSSKGSDFSELGKAIAEAKNVKAVVLIGKEGGRIGEAIGKIKKIRKIKGSGNMEEIVNLAYNNTVSGDVVLLSPACASFDMFKNYKDRGNQYKKAVRSLRLSAIRVRG
jgi:UDP-N-acetylmuramoylalanine--D-glutamate ligase